MNVFLFRLFTILISLYAIISNDHAIDLYVILHCLICIVSSYSLFSYPDQPYSFHKVYHIFTLFFFGISPVLQYYDNILFVNEPIIQLKVRITVSSIILITTILYNLIYMSRIKSSSDLKVKKYIFKFSKLKFYNFKLSKSMGLYLLSFSLFGLFMMLYINNFNILKLLIRGSEVLDANTDVSFTSNKTIDLITNQFIRPIPLIVFIISVIYNRKRWLLNLILFLIFLITCFPPALARNATAGFYLPLLLLFVPIFQKRHVFVSMMIGGLLVIFPFLDSFRYYDPNANLKLKLNYDMFNEMHFDAYNTFCRVVGMELITFGNQLLGVLFFFVPRSIWSTKPESSGIFHAEQLNLSFDNLACTYLAEGYINFGYIGVFLFLIVIALFSAYLDKIYWKYKNQKSYFNVLYVLILAMFLFILRGDLMNGFAYTAGVLLSSIIVYRLVYRLNSINFKI